MKRILPYHHYSTAHQGDRLPIERLEEQVVAMLLGGTVPDRERDSSIAFELKHSSAVLQFSRLLARRRKLPVDVCAAGGLLHDVYVIATGSYKDHAHQGTPIARKMMEQVGGFREQEIRDAESIVWHHSDKQLVSDDPFAEFGKDVDVLDAFLYPGAFDWYLATKPLDVFVHYLRRAADVWSSLGLEHEPAFTILDGFGHGWLGDRAAVAIDRSQPEAAVDWTAAPPFLLEPTVSGFDVRYSSAALFNEGAGDASDAQRLARNVAATFAARHVADLQPETLAIMVWPAISRYEVLLDDHVGRARLAALTPSVERLAS